MPKYVKASDEIFIPYLTAEDIDYIGEEVADNLTHMYRREGADFDYVAGLEGMYDTDQNSLNIQVQIKGHYDPDIFDSKISKALDKHNLDVLVGFVTFFTDTKEAKADKISFLIEMVTDDIEQQVRAFLA